MFELVQRRVPSGSGPHRPGFGCLLSFELVPQISTQVPCHAMLHTYIHTYQQLPTNQPTTMHRSLIPNQAVHDALRVNKGPSLGTDFSLLCPYTLLAHYHELPWAALFGVNARWVGG